MLGQIAEWFYEPVVFWGTPLVLAAAWAVVKRFRDKKKQEP